MGDDATPTHVIDHVFLGSKAHAKDRDQLKKLKITHILNVTPTKKLDPVAGVPNFFEKDKIFEYQRCAVFDNKAEDISGALEGCVAFIDRAKFYGRVLVHCSKGVSRSVSMVVAYLIKIHGLTYADALQLVQSKRSIAQPNASFEKQLIAYSDRVERLRKRKAMDARGSLAPAGPSRAPSKPQPSAEAIGPQLPPHLMKQKTADMEKGNEATSANHGEPSESKQAAEDEGHEEEVEEEGKAASIGPTLPTKRTAEASDDPDADTVIETKKPRVAGPARPPTA